MGGNSSVGARETGTGGGMFLEVTDHLYSLDMLCQHDPVTPSKSLPLRHLEHVSCTISVNFTSFPLFFAAFIRHVQPKTTGMITISGTRNVFIEVPSSLSHCCRPSNLENYFFIIKRHRA